MGKEPNTAVSEPKKGIVSSVLGGLGRLAVAPVKILIYPVWPMKVVRSVEITWPVKFTIPLFAYPRNLPKSSGEIWHDVKNGGRRIIGIPPEKYNKPILMTQGSEDLGITIESCKEGVVTFKTSRALTGDISYLTDEQLKEIEKKIAKYNNL